MLRVRSRNTPQVLRVVRELLAELQTESPVNLRRRHRIQEIVGEFVPFSAKIEPGLRKLMHKKWCKRTDIPQAVVLESQSLPGVPGLFFQRMSRRAYPQQIHHHE